MIAHNCPEKYWVFYVVIYILLHSLPVLRHVFCSGKMILEEEKEGEHGFYTKIYVRVLYLR